MRCVNERKKKEKKEEREIATTQRTGANASIHISKQRKRAKGTKGGDY